MRKSLLTLLFVGLFGIVASAQQEFASIELPMRRANDLVTVADDAGNVCVYFFQSGKLYFTLLSPSGEPVAQQEIPYRFSQEPQVLGTRITDEEFIFYSRHVNGRREYVRPFAIHRQTGAFRSLQDEQLRVERGEFFVGGFGDQDHFYMLYSDKKNNLHLYRDTDEDGAHMERRTFEAAMPRTRDRYERLTGLIYVHPDLEQNVFTGHHRSKIYTRGDSILMIFDGYRLRGEGDNTTTEILALDWDSGESTYRKLPAIEQKREPDFNSFLHHNTLFRVRLEKDALNLTAYDFSTLQPVKEYNYSGEEEIAIKATPVHQRGAKALFSPDDKVIEKTSKVMKSLASGIPAITVDAFSDSTIQLTIGSYQAPDDRRNNSHDLNRMVRTPDRYYQTSRGLMLMPGRWVPAYYIPSYYLNSPYYSSYFYDPGRYGANVPTGPGISTYFRAVLDSGNLDKVASEEAAVVLQDKIEQYEQELKPEPEYKTVYRYGDKLHYGYYDRKSNTFKIVEFAQK